MCCCNSKFHFIDHRDVLKFRCAISPFHISPAAAVHLSTNTLLGYFLRQPQDHLTFRKAARLSQRRTENFQHVYFPCVFRPMFGGRKAAARQPRDDRTVDVRIRTKLYLGSS